MSSISDQLKALPKKPMLDAIKKAGEGAFKMFGFRIRSTGFVWSVTQNKVEDIQKNAQVAANMVKVLDDQTAKLQDLAKRAAAANEAAVNDRNTLVERIQEAGRRAPGLQKEYSDAVDRFNKGIENKVSDADLERLEKDFKAKEAAFNAENHYLENQDKLVGEKDAIIKRSEEDVKLVDDAIVTFRDHAKGVFADVAKNMGLDDLLLEEYKFNPNAEWTNDKGEKKRGNFTNDKMSFTDQSSNLLQSWAATMKEGVELELKDSKGNRINVEDDNRLVNPLSRERYKTLKVEGDKAKVLSHDAIIVRNAGALQVYRKLFQQMMEEITATATRRHT
ncbi:MAG: hypothetical protein FJZ00_07620 [Candidatus Sericytochromatia bacterium]|uniref:Uncharacterized protein n=1 Tax=Candidatus Tanganyikabacteria bacterium TaxID=2961651 RepID=A0A937X615_9BACT|nr:hypothetical protein [Candidatus Tanganyikabacteria bacterium]